MVNGNKQGARIVTARKITLVLVLVAVLVSLAFDSGVGTPSSFGIGQFNLLCPLGGLEVLVSSKSLIPVATISAGVLLLFALVFGRAWCSFGCPVPPIRRWFKRDPEPAQLVDGEVVGSVGEGCSGCSAVRAGFDLAASLKFIGRDKRTWTFLAVLVAALIAGFPIFCLICPIGLTFGTVGSLWHLIVDKQLTMSVLVFPACLVVELVLYRKWCMNLCPVAGLLSIFGQFAVKFRPQVNTETCLRRSEGKPCDVCTVACSEHIDLHADDTAQQLGVCTRCGECAKKCPTASIMFK